MRTICPSAVSQSSTAKPVCGFVNRRRRTSTSAEKDCSSSASDLMTSGGSDRKGANLGRSKPRHWDCPSQAKGDPVDRSAGLPIDITIPGSPHDPREPVNAPPGVIVHRSPPLHPDDVTVVNGIPCTSIARTLVDCAEVMTRGRTARALRERAAEGPARHRRRSQIRRTRRVAAVAADAPRGDPRVRELNECATATKAEGEGFEPSVRLRAQRFSRPPDSTTLAPLRGRCGQRQRLAATTPGPRHASAPARPAPPCP